jgi:hypothetical protein
LTHLVLQTGKLVAETPRKEMRIPPIRHMYSPEEPIPRLAATASIFVIEC